MEAILAAVATVTTVVGDVFSMITGNALLTVFVAASLVGVGIRVFKSIKSAAK
ncbi:MAG: hypothetical protein LIO54_06650 [Oscillospiraceae bacterium]|nr:hypothetical protein [Oscillospiraceae bacterium]